MSWSAEPAELTFQLERAGEDPALCAELFRQLGHDSPLVREGAVYGLATLAEMIRDALARTAEHDPSPGVREAAAEALVP